MVEEIKSNLPISRSQYRDFLSSAHGEDQVNALMGQLGSVETVFIASNDTTSASDFKAALLKSELHRFMDSELSDPNKFLANSLGITVDDLNRFYKDSFINTFLSYINEGHSPDIASGKLFDFFHTSRSFGGADSSLLTNSTGGFFVLSNSGMFNFDLPLAIRDLADRYKKLQVLDLGSSTGLGAYSVAAILESERNDSAAGFDYELRGLDIKQKPLDLASKGVYTKDQINKGCYASDEAQKQDIRIEDVCKQAHVVKYGANVANQIMSVTQRIRSHLIEGNLVPLIMDVNSDGNYQIKEDVLRKISFARTAPFDIDHVDDNSQHLVSCFHTFDLLSDEGKAKLLENIARKLVSKGYLFSNILGHANPNEFVVKNPKSAQVIKKYFDILNNPSYAEGSLALSYLPALLRRKQEC